MNPMDVRCFVGDSTGRSCAGNPARVYWGTESESAETDVTEVFVSPGPVGWQVESCNAAGERIRFCGHGALAAAAVVARCNQDWRQPFSNHAMRWRALDVASLVEGADVTLQFDRPNIARCEVPEFANVVTAVPVLAAATAGGEDGYLILQVAEVAEVERVVPDYSVLSAATRRAVCLTAQTDTGFAFRYFAPQYGQPEDIATGSAAVQLAAFWATETKQQSFNVVQLSSAGGCMQVVCNDHTVELTGRVAYV